ncbi:hypothetical protein JCM11251_005506 [Rhodosporidiobolus azoricus]
MLDDPFVLNDKDRLPFSLPPSFASITVSSSITSRPTTSSAPFALLAPHLPPARPSLQHRSSGSSSSSKENATSSGGGPRRVYFSPTPLASLKSSPKHKRPFAVFLASSGSGNEGVGAGESAKRARRNVYSANPLLEALRKPSTGVEEEGLTSSSSPARSDGSSSSSGKRTGGRFTSTSPPTSSNSPTSSSTSLNFLLPPLRPSALRVSTSCKPSPPKPLTFPSPATNAAYSLPEKTLGTGSDSVMPFSLPGLQPVRLSPVQPGPTAGGTGDEDEATDSETESEVVSSLLLPSASVNPSPVKPAPVLFPSSVFSADSSSSSSSSSSLASSSPLPSPSRRGPTRPSAHRPSTSTSAVGLRSILKTRPPGAPGVGQTAKNEREGSRKNGRGRRHVLGWEDCKVQSMAQEAADAQEGGKGNAPTASSSAAPTDSGATDKGGLSGTTRRSTAASSSKRAVNGGLGGGAEDEDPNEQQPPRRNNGGGNGGGGPPPPSAPQKPDSQVPPGSNGAARIHYNVQLSDPILLRTPLLTLKASLRPVSQAYVRPAEEVEPLLPRDGSAPTLVEGVEDGLPLPLFETPTFLPDVEESYVLLTQALFRLPPTLLAGSEDLGRTLEPLVEMREEFLRCIRREVGNVLSFPAWVAEHPNPSSGMDDDEAMGSSPVSRRAAEKGKGRSKEGESSSAPAKGKKSLTEEQMRRMRDELGAAQAAVKCFAAVVRDQRVWGAFSQKELASLLALICSVPVSNASSALSPLVQKDLFPFIPFLLSSLTLPHSYTAPLLGSSILPSLRATLTLPPRIDRFRLSVSESLSALNHLITTHPREVFANENWRVWLRAAMAGLWEGSKKGVGTKEKAVKVAGRVVRALTAKVGEVGVDSEGVSEVEWVEEREGFQKEIGKEMLALLHDSPEDGPVDEQTKKPVTYLDMLLGTMAAAPVSLSNTAATQEANALQHLTLLALLPGLLGSQFRKIDERGIAPWIKPYNTYTRFPSVHVLGLSALTWSHLVYAFLRTTSDKGGDTWLFRKPDAKPFDLLGSIFRNRADMAWRKNDAADPGGKNTGRKEMQRVHAKALALAFCATIYGLTIYMRHGVSAIRPAPVSFEDLDAPLSSKQLSYHDLVFTKLLSAFLPSLTRTPVSHETPALGWQLFSSVLRPRTSNDATATLEALVNPAFLNGSLSQGTAPRAPDRQGLLTAAALSSAVQPGRVPAWGTGWVEKNVDTVLNLFEECLPKEGEDTLEQVVQPHYTVAWQNLLRTLSAAPSSAALDKAVSWLTAFDGLKTISTALWAATLARTEDAVVRAVDAALAIKVDLLETVTSAWSMPHERSKPFADVLARRWTTILEDPAAAITTMQVEGAVSLLRFHANSVNAFVETNENWKALAHAVNTAAWKDEPASRTVATHLSVLVSPPSNAAEDLRLCTLLVAASHDFGLDGQENILALSNHAVERMLEGERVSDENILLIANVLEAASAQAFPALYSHILLHLRCVVNPTSDDLLRFNPLITPALERTNELFLRASPETQAQSQASLQMSLVSHTNPGKPAHRPYFAFSEFWQSTFAKAEELEYPPGLVEALEILRVMTDLRLPGFVESQGESLETKDDTAGMAPAAGQIPPSRSTTLPTTATTVRDVSSRAYDADHSGLPRHSLHGSSLEDSFESRHNGLDGGGRLSPSLYATDRRDVPTRNETDDERRQEEKETDMTQDVAETPLEVEKERARASFASLAKSSSAVAAHESQPEQEQPQREKKPRADAKGKRKREVEELVIADSEDEEVVVSASHVKKSSALPRKKTRSSTAKSRRSSSSSLDEAASLQPNTVPRAKAPSRKRSRATVEVEVPVPAKKKRKLPGSKGKKATPTSSPPAEAEAVASSPPLNSHSSSPDSPINSQDDEAYQRYLALPFDTALRLGVRYGSPSIKRLMALGDRAREYFERFSQSEGSS